MVSTLDGAISDVAAILHAVKADVFQRLVGQSLRAAHRVAERRDAEHAPAGGNNFAVGVSGAGMEHLGVLERLAQGDRITLAWRFRIIGGSDDYAECDTDIP